MGSEGSACGALPPPGSACFCFFLKYVFLMHFWVCVCVGCKVFDGFRCLQKGKLRHFSRRGTYVYRQRCTVHVLGLEVGATYSVPVP